MCYQPNEVQPLNLKPWVILFASITIVMVLIANYVVEKQQLDAEKELYCLRVAQGRWPDFNHNYKAECTFIKE